MSGPLYTIGYERLQPGPLTAELLAAGVERVIDVRFRPQSRRPGMSKTKLGAWLGDHGIAYEHRRALGTPHELRALFHAGRIEEGRAGYRAHLDADPDAAEALGELAAELQGGAPATALLCLEADPAVCHRRVVTEMLTERLPGLRVTDL